MLNFSRNSIKLTIIGDTHLRHEELGTLSGDVLIHVGDMFSLFERNDDDFERMDAWYARQKFDRILCIGGNHDFPIQNRRNREGPMFRNATYLEDEAFEYKDLRFYGTPWVPFLNSHAFYAGERVLREKWSQIPSDTDVLITHTPPFGILDRSSRGQDLGCVHLAERIAEIAPKIHCFGHVHANGGTRKFGKTTCINASCLYKEGGPIRRPVQIRIRPGA